MSDQAPAGRTAAARRRTVGARGEAVAARYLTDRGFEILDRNVRVGHLELARRNRLLVVCEVRARSSDRIAHPAETIDAHKIERVRRGAARWLAEHPELGSLHTRVDAAAIVFDAPGGAPRIEYYEDV